MATRRMFLGSSLAAMAAGGRFPVRAITKGPKFHWFGYYDKLQFDPGSRYVLGHEVAFEHRSPRPEDEIRVGMVDLQDGDRWIDLGSTRAWNWQQGAMLQWLPGSKEEVIWNDRRDGRFVSVVKNVRTGKERVIPAPVYTVSPDGRWGIYPDFRRLNDCRPGYGYAGIPDPNREVAVPGDAGIWRVGLASGKTELVIPFAEAVAVANPKGYSKGAKHWFNHLLYNTDGSRFVFLHRWRGEAEGAVRFSTRMFTARADGTGLYVLDPHGQTSHFVWRDQESVLAWAWHPSKGRGFYLYRDRTEEVEPVGAGVMTENGHCTYLPGNRWILNDTYPDKARNQNLYVYEVATGRRVELGSFRAPEPYRGEWRCDTHPRANGNGRLVCIDSAHGEGRQMYLVGLGELGG